MSENNKPAFSAKVGNVEATVWEQEGQHGNYYTVTLHRNYKDGEEWKKTTSLRATDVHSAQTAYQLAYEFMKVRK